MARRKKARKPVAPARFKVGDKVRVKHGVKDTDYRGTPLGGWAGTICEIHDDSTYTIRWSSETLATIHPVVKKRSEKDGTVLGEYWLGDDDLEPDSGSPLDIEQPTEIKTKPLSPKDQDDRIRMVFGLTSNDPLPNVDEGTLLRYHEYLSKNMRFPFKVDHYVETGPFEGRKETVTVLSLLDPANDPPDETEGLICQARMDGDTIEMRLAEFEVDEDAPGLQIVADYCSWFWNSGAAPDDHEAEHEPQYRLATPKDRLSGSQHVPLSAGRATAQIASKSGLLGAFYGIVLGTAIRVIPEARQGVYIGSTIFGLLGAIVGARYGLFFGAVNRMRFGRIFGSVFGLANGVLLGAYLGVVLTAWKAAILGAILSGLIVRFLHRERRDLLSLPLGAIAGAGIGTGILGFYRDYDRAVDGMIYGGTIGTVVGVALLLAVVMFLNVLPSERND